MVAPLVFRRRSIIAAAFVLVVAASASAQMDMLPQILRDLPPELEQGLPERMTYADYRALNRQVDFFTMFMSMFVPGYGLFQVERPDLAWPVVGARVAGYGLMATGIGLQWNHFYELSRGRDLAEADFDRLLANGLIFGAGVIVAGMTWPADVILAHHIAKRDRELVQYRFGVRSSIYQSGGGDDPASEERYLRGLLVQQGDAAVESLLLRELPSFAARYPDEPFSGEALFHAAGLYAGLEEDADALRYAIRASHLYPRGPRTEPARRLTARVLERNPSWGLSYEEAVALTRLPASEGPDARFLAGALKLSRLDSAVLKRAGLAETRAFLAQYGDGPYLADGLSLAAGILVDLDRPAEAAGYLAALAVRAPDSEHWPIAVLRLAELYLGPLADRERADVLLAALIEKAPDTPQATRARELKGR